MESLGRDSFEFDDKNNSSSGEPLSFRDVTLLGSESSRHSKHKKRSRTQNRLQWMYTMRNISRANFVIGAFGLFSIGIIRFFAISPLSVHDVFVNLSYLLLSFTIGLI